MTDATAVRPALLESVAELRRAFDESFAAPISQRERSAVAFLTLRAAGYPLALPLVDLARIEGRRKVVPLPTESPDFVGLAGIQGRLVPVYDLALLLGIAQPPTPWQWLALCAGTDALAFAFESFHGYLRVPQSQVGIPENENAREYLSQAVRDGQTVWRIVRVPALVAAVRQRAGASQDLAPET